MLFNIKKKSKFNYIEEGEGAPLVLLHGLMGSLSNFEGLTQFFSKKGYKVYAPELPIYSMSTLNSNVANMAKFVSRFVKEVVKEPAVLIGNSLGGHIGLVVSVDHPEQVKALVLTGSSGLYEKGFGETFPKRGNYDYVKKKTQEVFYDPAVATKEIVDEVYETVNDNSKAIKTLYIARSAIKHNMKKQLSDLKKPVCLIWGKQDSVTPPEVAVQFHEGLPDSDLFWINKCGHAPMMEYPDEFNEVLFGWLSSREI